MASIRVGVALGGGGARGISHIPVLEAIDELGITPYAITGTSIGSLVGAGYASGLSGAELKDYFMKTLGERNVVLNRLWQLRPRNFSELLSTPRLVQFNTERILKVFAVPIREKTFEDLQIPFFVIATDFYNASEYVLSKGPLLPAVAGSIAIPFIFKPVQLNNRILIDGGAVNPLPFDRLPEECNICVAVDVIGGPTPRLEKTMPSATEAAFGGLQILLQTASQEKLKLRQPDLIVRPRVNNFQVIDFLKVKEILETTAPIKEVVKRQLGALIELRLKNASGPA
ncbi:patatin-like phospholipase family protein [Flexibacterium corallicola]|uniref:patatin-like phospholipase family protein n=1 Tax=Flexibacterium corallicola TaxID=3037259 RepID=UPI00286F13CD|nr:patatin-like phospholipase family protein [Pseudovibrio sp. M1P-2-3]